MSANLEQPHWTEPGPVEVAPGVHRLPLPLPDEGLKAVNVYAVETADGLVLIDAGWPTTSAREVLANSLASMGAGFGDVARFLVTHAHRDHYGMAVEIRSEFGTRVEIGIGERPSIELLMQPSVAPLAAQLDRMEAFDAGEFAGQLRKAIGTERIDVKEWQLPDAWILPGTIKLPGGRNLEAVETPGHTNGHVVFHDLDAGVLFAGDHVLPRITPSLGFEAAPVESPLASFMASLSLMLERPDALLLPAHGPVAPSVHARVHELLAFHENRLAEMLAAVVAGATTVLAVGQQVGWTRRATPLEELNGFNKMLAIFETSAHLEVLRSRGQVTRLDVDGIWRFASS